MIRRRRIQFLLLAVLFLVPTLWLGAVDRRFSVWISPLPASTTYPGNLRVEVSPSQPIFEGTEVTITVVNQTKTNETEATVFILDSDGEVILENTVTLGESMSYSYSGNPVIVYAESKSLKSQMSVIGAVPAIWIIAVVAAIPAMVFLLLVALGLYSKASNLKHQLDELEEKFQDQSKRIMASNSIDNLRKKAIIETSKTLTKSSHELPDVNADDISLQLVEFLSEQGIGEHFLFGLAFAAEEVTGDKRVDRKLAIFGMVQAFEELLVCLGRISEKKQIREKFMKANRITLVYALKMLLNRTGKLSHQLSSFSGFDRSNATQDFDRKLKALLSNSMTILSPSEESFEQPNRSFVITTLVRNFCSHISMLDSELFNNQSVFNSTMEQTMMAIVQAYLILRPR